LNRQIEIEVSNSYAFPTVGATFLNTGTKAAMVHEVIVEYKDCSIISTPVVAYSCSLSRKSFTVFAENLGWGDEAKLRIKPTGPLSELIRESNPQEALVTSGEKKAVAFLSFDQKRFFAYRENNVDKFRQSYRSREGYYRRLLQSDIESDPTEAAEPYMCLDSIDFWASVNEGPQLAKKVSLGYYCHASISSSGFELVRESPPCACMGFDSPTTVYVARIEDPNLNSFAQLYRVDRLIGGGQPDRFEFVVICNKSVRGMIRLTYKTDADRDHQSEWIPFHVHCPRKAVVPEEYTDGLALDWELISLIEKRRSSLLSASEVSDLQMRLESMHHLSYSSRRLIEDCVADGRSGKRRGRLSF